MTVQVPEQIHPDNLIGIAFEASVSVARGEGPDALPTPDEEDVDE